MSALRKVFVLSIVFGTGVVAACTGDDTVPAPTRANTGDASTSGGTSSTSGTVPSQPVPEAGSSSGGSSGSSSGGSSGSSSGGTDGGPKDGGDGGGDGGGQDASDAGDAAG